MLMSGGKSVFFLEEKSKQDLSRFFLPISKIACRTMLVEKEYKDTSQNVPDCIRLKNNFSTVVKS